MRLDALEAAVAELRRRSKLLNRLLEPYHRTLKPPPVSTNRSGESGVPGLGTDDPVDQ